MNIFGKLFGNADGNEDREREELTKPIPVAPGLFFPAALARHWEEIKATRMDSVHISCVPQQQLSLRQSKFGGYPYLPAGFDYPRDSSGAYLFPLAQINFAEVPPLPGFPVSGYLQFYISAYDGMYGLDLDYPDEQLDFRVLYFEETEFPEWMSDFTFLDEVMYNSDANVSHPQALRFTRADDYIGMTDHRSVLPGSFNVDNCLAQYPAATKELENFLWEHFSCAGHKMGGYAYFTQTDPRENSGKYEDFVPLLQIDTDDHIIWGDAGVANFFIHPDDLAMRDFSKVLYNWDCS